MGYVIYSDAVLNFALISAVAVFLLNGALIVVSVYLRLSSLYRARKTERLRERWRPVFAAAVADAKPIAVPMLGSGDIDAVLRLWLHLQESVAGDASVRLNELARVSGLEKAALNALDDNDLLRRFIAITAVGHMHLREAWITLETELRGSNPYLSLAAGQAMMRIDAAKAIEMFLHLARSREDWPPSRVYLILLHVDTAVLEPALRRAVLDYDEAPPAYFIRYLEALPPVAALRIARPLLRHDAPTEIICGALELLRDPSDIAVARDFLGHSAWQVRVQAAKALGRVGLQEDVARLCELLTDYEWWVRYRAAEAIVQLPFVTPQMLNNIKRDQIDPYAVDMLDQAAAESRARRVVALHESEKAVGGHA